MKNKKLKNDFTKFARSYGVLLLVLVIEILFFSMGSPYFFTFNNLIAVFRQIAPNAYIAAALCMVFIIGGADLSTGNVLALAGMLSTGLVVEQGLPIPVAIIISLAAGALAGFTNGFFAAYTKMPPFIITYAVGNICKGIEYIYCNADTYRITDKAFTTWGAGYIGPIPIPVVIAVVIFIAVNIVLTRTKLGRQMYAAGGNPTAARYAGINTPKLTLMVYTFCGTMAALAGFITASRTYAGIPTVGGDTAMAAIAAVILGGVSMGGGRGGIPGAILGSLIMGVMSNGFNLMGVNTYWQYIARGVILIAAVYVDYQRNNAAFVARIQRFTNIITKKEVKE